MANINYNYDFSKGELFSKINKILQSGCYTPEESDLIINQLRQLGLYPLKLDSEFDLVDERLTYEFPGDFLWTSESAGKPFSEEEPKEIPGQPGHEPFVGPELSRLDEELLKHLLDSLIGIPQRRSHDLPKAESVSCISFWKLGR